MFFLSGESNPLTTLFNFSSYWINGTNGQPTLYMITYADSRSVLPTNCVVSDRSAWSAYVLPTNCVVHIPPQSLHPAVTVRALHKPSPVCTEYYS